MNYTQNNQNPQVDLKLSVFDIQEVNGILYFTVDFGDNDQQRWKTDGTTSGTVFVNNVQASYC